MKTKKLTYFMYLTIVIVVIIVVTAGFFRYQKLINSAFNSYAHQSVEQILDQQRFNVKQQIQSDVFALKNMAIVVEDHWGNNLKNIEDLSKFLKNSNFDNLFVLDINGSSLKYNEASKINCFDREYFQRSLTGETYVGDPVISKAHGDVVTPISTPIYGDNNNIIGVLVGTYTVEKLQNLLLPSFNGCGITHIIDKTGMLVVSTDNLYNEDLKYNVDVTLGPYEVNYLENSEENLMKDMKAGISGCLIYELDGKIYYAQYCPLYINDWYIIETIPKSALLRQTTTVQRHTINLATIVLCTLIVLLVPIGFMLNYNQSVIKSSYEDLKVAIALSQRKMIRYDIKKKTADFFGNSELELKACELLESIDDANKADIIAKYVKPIKTKILKGEKNGIDEISICNANKEEIWYQVEYTTIFDDHGQPNHCFFSIADITQEHSEREALILAATIDGLTGVLNRSALEEKIKQSLEMATPNQKHALLVIDLDDLKSINDNKGHPVGDNALRNLSEALKEVFDEDAIVGRTGGDEFLVFLPNLCSIEFVEEKARKISEIIQPLKDGTILTTSIGIVVSAGSKTDLKQLYEYTDNALYVAKNNGKNQYSIQELNNNELM